MRVIHLIRATTWGGGERYARDLCEYSLKEGLEVTIFTRGKPEVDNHLDLPGSDLRHAPIGGIFDFSTPRKLASYIMGLPDREVIVHVHTFKDAELVARAKGIVGKRKKVTLICTRHLVKPGKSSLRWKWIYGAIDRLIFVSDLAKREFLKTDPPISGSKICVIHNSILLTAPFSDPDIHDAVGGSDDKPPVKLLYAGRVSPEKGIDVLIKSMAMLSDYNVTLSIAGTGPDEVVGDLKDLAEQAGVGERVQWLGFVENVFEKIREADICVAPSTARESFGLTVIEFMSQGRPVVTTCNGAQPEIITDGYDGMLVAPDDPEALAGSLRRLIESPALRNDIGGHAAATFHERFTYPIFFSKILEVYKEEPA